MEDIHLRFERYHHECLATCAVMKVIQLPEVTWDMIAASEGCGHLAPSQEEGPTQEQTRV